MTAGGDKNTTPTIQGEGEDRRKSISKKRILEMEGLI